MALTPLTLIVPTTSVQAAVGTSKFELEQKFVPGSIYATNLGAGESVAILFSVDGGATFEPVSQDSEDLTLTETNNSRSINSPVFFGVTKTATVANVGVFLLYKQPSR